jgi:copper(I)-binding protein
MIESHGRSGFGRVTRRIGVVIAAAATGALLLTGCAAGQHAQTVAQYPVVDGVAADSGPVGIRDAALAAPNASSSYATGQDAPLELVLVNNGTATDSLVSVSSTSAGGAILSMTGPPAASATPAPASASGSASASTPASGSASASASTSPSASVPGAVPSGSSSAASVPIPVPAGSSVRIGSSAVGPAVVLTGLTTALFPSQTVPVVFTFSSGARIQATLAVRLSSGGAPAPSIDISPSEAG